MHIFGLTGGIACGKSTVAARLSAHDLPVIDADELARAVVAAETDGLRAIVRTFGPTVLDRNGSLDRQAVARIVFSDVAALEALNAITHPLIGKLMAVRAAELERRGEPMACYEAALIVEKDLSNAFRPLVVVACPEEIQLARLRARGRSSLDDGLARMRAQKPLSEKVAVADFVIDTGGTLEASARQTDEVLAAICAKLGIDPARYRWGLLG